MNRLIALTLFSAASVLASSIDWVYPPGIQSDGTLGTNEMLVYNADGTVGDGSGTSNATIQCGIVLPTNSIDWRAGQISYDTASKTLLADTGFPGVRVNIGQEVHVPVYNGTGVTITNGTPVSGSGLYALGVPSVVPADADNVLHIIGYLGVTTTDIEDSTFGLATYIGAIRGVDTSGLSVAPAFLKSGGGISNIVPLYPTKRLLIGGISFVDSENGVIGTLPINLPRSNLNGSYGFSSRGIGAGTYYKAGYYDWESTSTTISQVGPTQTLGNSLESKASRPGIVPSGPGTVDAGQVGLRVIGISDSESGSQIAGVTNVISTNITELVTDTLYETDSKFSGQVTYELFVVSGSPTTYSLTFNYGWSKYEDFNDQDFTIKGIDCVWLSAATDSDFEIRLLHHATNDWTYASTGFVPGGYVIASKSSDQQLAGSTINNYDGAWKRTNVDFFVDGNADEGVVIEITTGQNNTIQTMDINVSAVSEELSL